jgi:hypothetical protein
MRTAAQFFLRRTARQPEGPIMPLRAAKGPPQLSVNSFPDGPHQLKDLSQIGFKNTIHNAETFNKYLD